MLRIAVAAVLCVAVYGSLEPSDVHTASPECLVGDTGCGVTSHDVEILEEAEASVMRTELLQTKVAHARVHSQASKDIILQHGNKETSVHGRKAKRVDINQTAVWEQLKGSVDIEEIQEQISSVANSSQVVYLKDQLAKLQAQFPDSAEIRAQFQDKWGDIKEAVDMDNLHQQLESATGEAKDRLQAKYNDLIAEHPDLSVDNMKARATEMWGNLADNLPNLDDLTAKAQEMASQFGDALQGAKGQVDSIADNIGNTIGNWFR